MFDFSAWPPLHPLFVHFTSALLPVSVGLDVCGKFLRRDTMLHAGWWSMLIGTAVTPLTVLYGWRWWWSMDGAELTQRMQIHQWLGVSLMVVYLALTFWRSRFHFKSKKPTIAYLIVTIAVTLLLAWQGHLGAEMSFGT